MKKMFLSALVLALGGLEWFGELRGGTWSWPP
jgi:hypothetical protein